MVFILLLKKSIWTLLPPPPPPPSAGWLTPVLAAPQWNKQVESISRLCLIIWFELLLTSFLRYTTSLPSSMHCTLMKSRIWILLIFHFIKWSQWKGMWAFVRLVLPLNQDVDGLSEPVWHFNIREEKRSWTEIKHLLGVSGWKLTTQNTAHD